MNSFVSSASSLACASPTRTCARRGQDLLDLRDELLVVTPGLAATRDLVELARLVEQPLRGREVEAGERRAADRRDRAEPDDPGDPQLLDGALGLDADRLADLEVLLVRGRLVDDDLVRRRARRPRRAPAG